MRNLHVNQSHPSANDRSDGSLQNPFKTISTAAKIAEPGDTIIVSEGVYRERVAPANGGEEGKPICYTAVAGDNVFVRGSDIWRPKWEAHTKTALVAPLEASLFADHNPFVLHHKSYDSKIVRPPEGDELEPTRGQIFLDGRGYWYK